jgi:Caspase domain
MSRFKSLLVCAGLLGSLLSFGHGTALAQTTNAEIASGVQSPPKSLVRAAADPLPAAATANGSASPTLSGPEQRVALVIGNSNYQSVTPLPNPDNDAQSMAQFLNSAGFEVVEATDLTQNDMIKVVQDFSARVSAHGPNTVAMIYYAGHGVQLAGENYLVPVDAKISSPADLVNDSVRLVDVMATLEAIPSRMRIVVLDACRNNPFPTINDAGRGLAIVDAPNGSIVGYSTAPGAEAQDGAAGHSPYTSAFLRLAREPNLPIEQLFKRIRLEVNHSTEGQQTPWESSSLTSDFYFFGDTAVAATRPPAHGPIVQMASNLPGRSVRQAYDYVLSEGSPEYYQEFVTLFPYDPLCDRIRWLLHNLVEAAAWHKAVIANSPLAYKAFYDQYSNSPYAQSALKLQSQPKVIPLMQPTHLIVSQQLQPTLKLTGVGGQVYHMPNGIMPKQPSNEMPLSTTKIVTLPATNPASSNNGSGTGKIVTMPVGTVGKAGSLPVGTVGKTDSIKTDSIKDLKEKDLKVNNPTNRIVDAAVTPKQTLRTEVRETPAVKLNSNPTPVNRFQGNAFSGKTGGLSGGNSGPRFAQSMGGGGGFGRKFH